MPWNLQADPFYRWLLKEAADLEWRAHEDCFEQALKEPDGVADQAKAVQGLLQKAATE